MGFQWGAVRGESWLSWNVDESAQSSRLGSKPMPEGCGSAASTSLASNQQHKRQNSTEVASHSSIAAVVPDMSKLEEANLDHIFSRTSQLLAGK
eukprot:6255532-Amphidinium_carterae.2